MKKVSLVIVVLFLAGSLISCSKKQETLEEMQQPMSPEDLNRIKTETRRIPEANVLTGSLSQAGVGSSVGANLEPLPPGGPYQPGVKEIQSALKNAGFYSGALDGKIGPRSKKAIEEFQKTNSLTVDGKVGPKTWAALSKYVNAVGSDSGLSAQTAGE